MNHVYETSTGKLISSTTLEVKGLRAGLAVKASDKTGVWDTTSLDFIPRPETKIISRLDFLRSFTDPEFEGIIGASRTNDKAEMFLVKLEVAGFIDLKDSGTIRAVNGLAQLDLLTPERASEILA